jgi:hypothetical protein
LETT